MESKAIPPLPPLPILSTTIGNKISNEYLLPNPQDDVSNTCLQFWKYITGDSDGKCVVSVYHQTKPILQDGPKYRNNFKSLNFTIKINRKIFNRHLQIELDVILSPLDKMKTKANTLQLKNFFNMPFEFYLFCYLCGLVALCMASQLLLQTLTIEEVFSRAKTLGFTHKGEMFSANNMSQLAKDLLQCQVDVIINLKKHKDIILTHLLHGLPILIPYDADRNHEPCCKSGHAAHWAVITGFCIVLNEIKYKSKFIGMQDSNIKKLYHWSDNILPFNFSDDEQIYVYARHGKSNRIAVWNFDCLCESNSNLKELGAKHIVNDFILPEKGMFCELANKALLLF